MSEPDVATRIVRGLVHRTAQEIEAPSGGAKAAIERARAHRRLRIAGVLMGSLVATAALLLPLLALLELRDRPASVRRATPTPAPSPSTEISVAPPEGPGPFHGKPYREGASLVMPITFPDGTTAEVVYPTTLELGTEYVWPGAFVQGGPRGCYEEIHFSRSEIVGNFTSSGPPLAVFEGIHGDPVALWSGKRWLQPLDVLAFDFGDWVAMVFCQVDDVDTLSTLAGSLDGHPTPDGLFVVTPRPPIRLVDRGFQVGPRVTLDSGRTPLLLVELTVSGCSPSPAEIVQGSSVDGCFHGGIGLYAQGNHEFLKAVSEGLQVRNVEKPQRR
jgi:hypothetical protein